MNILLLSHTYYGSPFRVGSHFLFEEFKKSNHEVRHMSTPITPLHRILRMLNPQKYKSDADRFLTKDNTLGNVVPRTYFPIQMRLTTSFVAKKFKAELSQKTDLIIIDQVYFLRFMKYFHPEARVILRLTDHISKKSEINLIQKGGFSKIVVTNEHILENLNVSNTSSIVIPNGYNSVKLIPTSPDIKRSGMIYVGSLDSRIDWQLIQAIAKDPKFECLHIYGLPKPKTSLPANVNYFGVIPHKDTFTLYQHFKFGILPYKFSPENICRSPMKLYEYIASGLVVLVPDFLKRSQYSENESISTFTSWMHNDLERWDNSISSVSKNKLGLTWKDISKQILFFAFQADDEMIADSL